MFPASVLFLGTGLQLQPRRSPAPGSEPSRSLRSGPGERQKKKKSVIGTVSTPSRRLGVRCPPMQPYFGNSCWAILECNSRKMHAVPHSTSLGQSRGEAPFQHPMGLKTGQSYWSNPSSPIFSQTGGLPWSPRTKLKKILETPLLAHPGRPRGRGPRTR